jgi:uncharacterized membrane protein YqjE
MKGSNPTSLFGSLKRLGELATAAAHNRLELFSVELQEEKCHFIQVVLLTAAAIALGITALTLVTITIIVLFWENARTPALCVLSGVLVIATCWTVRSLRKSLMSAPGFAGTLGDWKRTAHVSCRASRTASQTKTGTAC